MYVSWFVLLATVVVGFLLPSKEPQKEKRSRLVWVFSAILFSVTIIATRLDRQTLTAVLQWWAQVMLLGACIVSVKRQQVPWKTLATWFMISLIPFTILGFVQYATQEVWGGKWLGIAAQLSQNSGVSVVEHGAYRILRVYGGFSHPNIFGGWLAIGVLTSLLMSLKVESKRDAIFCALTASSFSVALLLTYARSAWLAMVIAGTILLVHVFRTRRASQFFWLALVASFLSVAIVGFSQRDHILARGDTSSRLESLSVNTRIASLQDGVDTLLMHPLIGTGPNAELYVTWVAEQPFDMLNPSPVPFESPHNVFLLAVENFGFIGMAIIIALLFLVVRTPTRRLGVIAFFAPLLIIGLFDHYFWSYWSGQSLVALAILLSNTQDPRA